MARHDCARENRLSQLAGRRRFAGPTIRGRRWREGNAPTRPPAGVGVRVVVSGGNASRQGPRWAEASKRALMMFVLPERSDGRRQGADAPRRAGAHPVRSRPSQVRDTQQSRWDSDNPGPALADPSRVARAPAHGGRPASARSTCVPWRQRPVDVATGSGRVAPAVVRSLGSGDRGRPGRRLRSSSVPAPVVSFEGALRTPQSSATSPLPIIVQKQRAPGRHGRRPSQAVAAATDDRPRGRKRSFGSRHADAPHRTAVGGVHPQ